MAFDWHCNEITAHTRVDAGFATTQNVRRFMRERCGEGFRFDRDFRAWIDSAAPTTMAALVDEWFRRHVEKKP